jgi:hypothetical protein
MRLKSRRREVSPARKRRSRANLTTLARTAGAGATVFRIEAAQRSQPGLEQRELGAILTNVAQGKNMSAILTFVDYAPQIYSY